MGLGLALLALAIFAAPGCGPERSERWTQPLDVSGPVEAGSSLVYVNKTLEQITVVTPKRVDGSPTLEVRKAATGSSPGTAAVSADGTTLFLVNEDDETLQSYDLESDALDSTTVDLQGAYDVISVDPYGQYLLLSFSGSSDAQIVARNLNEVGIVDLTGDKPDPSFVTLQSRPERVVFAPPFDLGGNPQRLAAVMSRNEVTVLDLLADQVDDQLREVPLTISQADSVRTPRQIAFDVTPSQDQPDVVQLYVLSDNSQDITEISVQPAARTGAQPKLDLFVDELAAGSHPGAMTLLDLDVGPRLLAVDSRDTKFTLVDIESGEGATFDLPMDLPASRLLTYTTTVEKGGAEVPETRVLAYTPNSPIMAVIRPETISIAGDQPTLGRSVEALRIDQRPASIRLAEGQPDRAVVFHPGANSGFAILDLRKNVDIPIQGGSPQDIYFDGQNAYVVFKSLKNLSVFDLDGHPTNFDLPKVGEHIFVESDPNTILVQHRDAMGSFTVLDATKPLPDTARVYDNVFLDELLDQELP